MTDISNSKYFMGNSKQISQGQPEKLNIQKLRKLSKNVSDTERDNNFDKSKLVNNENDLRNYNFPGSPKNNNDFFNDEENLDLSEKNNPNKINRINKNYFVKEYSEDNLMNSKYLKGENPNSSLTNKVWPKSRTFLSIVSKMFNENYINDYQRGLLKEMIMDQNQDLDYILDEYEIDGDSNKLYQNIIALAYSYDKK